MSFSSHFITCAGREIHYTQWGATQAPVVVAWHGLARTGRDMDELARHLAPRYRVICPDTLGRGLSQWAARPAEEYCLAFYARLAADLFDELGIETAQWVGTSMGGLIGMVLAFCLCGAMVDHGCMGEVWCYFGTAVLCWTAKKGTIRP